MSIRDSQRATRAKRPKKRPLVLLATVADVIDLGYGGNAKAARATGRGQQAVSNWRTLGLPPTLFLLMTRQLQRRGFRAPAELWKQEQIAPANGRASASL